MGLSKAKKERMAKAEREAFVKKVSITGNSHAPFLDYYWDEAAKNYIETGDESYKEFFPTTPRR